MAVDRSKTAQILVVPLLLILVGLVWLQLQPRGAGGPAAPLTSSQHLPAVLEESSSPPETEAGAPPTIDRDPFMWPSALRETIQAAIRQPDTTETTPQVESVPMPTLKIQGIFWGTTPHRAIMNDQILTEGDTIEGVRIVSIDRQGITVEFQGTQSTLSVPTPGTTTHE